MNLDKLGTLEERIGRTLDTLKRLREENSQLNNDIAQLRGQCLQQAEQLNTIKQENQRYLQEKDEVVNRLEKMLADLEQLGLA